MVVTPENVTCLGDLDHPESVCVGPEGELYAGGELGQLYRLWPDGRQEELAQAGGNTLGLALDGAGRLHVCNPGLHALLCVSPDGSVRTRTTGVPERPLQTPNFCVFDAQGNLYISDTGDYWSPTGTGAIWVVRPDDTAEVFHAGPFRAANGLAIDPRSEWLSVAQSSAWNIVRIPLGAPHGQVQVTHTLPEHTVPDGLAFTADGRLLIACYRPDVVYVGHPDGRLEVLVEDLTGELLDRPTGIALGNGKLYLANLGRRHLSVLDTDLQPRPLYRPELE